MFPLAHVDPKETLMSHGPGRVQRNIEDLFQNNPSATFTTEDLVACAYPGRNRVEKSHRVAVLRAAVPVPTECGGGCNVRLSSAVLWSISTCVTLRPMRPDKCAPTSFS